MSPREDAAARALREGDPCAHDGAAWDPPRLTLVGAEGRPAARQWVPTRTGFCPACGSGLRQPGTVVWGEPETFRRLPRRYGGPDAGPYGRRHG